MTYNGLTVDPNLIARHLLNDNAASNVVAASVGSDGWLHRDNWAISGGNTSAIATTGPYGGALDLDGVDKAIGIPCVVGTVGAACFRLRLDSAPGAEVYAFSHRNGSSNSRIYLVINADRTLTLTYGSGGTATTASALIVGQWYSVVITWSGDTGRAYIDGLLVATVTSTFSGGWLGRYTLGAFSQYSAQVMYFSDITVQDSLTFNRLLVVDDAIEYDDGPEPLNTVVPVLHDDGTVTSGTWDSQSNGTITRLTTLHLASDDSVVTTSSATNPDFSSYVTTGSSYYVIERAANDGGYDDAEDTASEVVEIVGDGEPAEGSGTISLVVSTIGEGRTVRQGNGTVTLTASSQGEGWRVSSGNGQNTLSVSAVGEGYHLPSGYGESCLTLSTNGEGSRGAGGSGSLSLTVNSFGIGYRQSQGSGELPAIITTIGEGYATTGSYGETLLIASSSGQGYVIRSGAGLAAMQVGTVGNGQSTEPATSGILALQTIDGLYLIGF